MTLAALFASLFTSTPASHPGENVSIQVVDADLGTPVATATLRHPFEEIRHSVNTASGTWQGYALYAPDGSEQLIERGDELAFDVSAPGYISQSVTYRVRRRKNTVVVVLEPMEVAVQDLEEDVQITFARDVPLD